MIGERIKKIAFMAVIVTTLFGVVVIVGGAWTDGRKR